KTGTPSFTPLHASSEISPLMDENVRAVLERRADKLRLAHERVHHLRVEVRRDSLRMFVNGRLASESAGNFEAGQLQVSLSGPVHLLGADAEPLPEVPQRFVTVPLDDFFNARGPARPPGLSQAPGRVASVEGIPFTTSVGEGGEDNLDLAPSIYLNRLG